MNQAVDYYMISGLENDPPEQRAWLRHAVSVAQVFHTRRVPKVPVRVATATVMLGADYLWMRDREAASFLNFDAEGFTESVCLSFFGPRPILEAYLECAAELEVWLRTDPSALESLPLPILEENEFMLTIPLGPNPDGPPRVSHREAVRAAARRVTARMRKRGRYARAPLA